MTRRSLLLGTLLAGCSRRSSGPAALPVRMAIGGRSQLIYLSATLAGDLGFFADEGLAVALQDFPGGAKSLEALLGGSAEVVCGFYDHTVQMAAQGRDLRAFVAMLRYPGLVAVGGPGIARVEDLKGKTVGVSAPGSSTHLFLNYLLATHGMKQDDVSTASIGMGSSAVGAMTHAKVDAAIMTDPALEIARKQTPALRILADTRTAEGVNRVFGVDVYPSVVLYSTASWLATHHEAAQRLVRAMTRTVAWMRTHPAEEIRRRMPAELRTEDVEADVQGLRTAQAMLSLDGRITTESAAAVLKVLSVSLDSVRTASIDLGKTHTDEFLDSELSDQ